MLFIVLWTEWAIALVCVHYVTPLHGWLSKAVLTLIQLGTLCVLFHHLVFNKHEHNEHWLEMMQVSRTDVSVICFDLEF
jgi:hypothetical protein